MNEQRQQAFLKVRDWPWSAIRWMTNSDQAQTTMCQSQLGGIEIQNQRSTSKGRSASA